MSVIFLLIPLSIVIAACFFAAFIWAVRSGQYEDTCTPSMRLLTEEKTISTTDAHGCTRISDENPIARMPDALVVATADALPQKLSHPCESVSIRG